MAMGAMAAGRSKPSTTGRTPASCLGAGTAAKTDADPMNLAPVGVTA